MGFKVIMVVVSIIDEGVENKKDRLKFKLR
jgi:hypothetical protein